MFSVANQSQFKKLFIEKLKWMLDSEHIGAFILVLANSQQDSELRSALQDDLGSAFDDLKKRFNEIRGEAPKDDVDVFEHLLGINLSEIPLWKTRKEGCWDITCNTIRKLRPARASAQVLTCIKKDFDSTAFNFNKPFLQPEIVWQGEYNNTRLRVLYNKFPFADYHLLLAVSPEDEYPQVINMGAHELIHGLVQETAGNVPGFGIGFNSLAAGASVNHLHFQSFIRQQLFPIENSCWNHNGGDEGYPLDVYRFDNAVTAWNKIEQLTSEDIAFNCLYREEACYVVPRKYQGTVDLPFWLQGAGWLDVSGVMTVPDDEVFQSISAEEIMQALSLLEIP